MTSRPPCVTLISGSLPEMPCGVGDYTARLAAAMAAEGVDVRIVTSRDARIRSLPAVTIDQAADGWRLHDLPHLIRAIRRGRPDIVHLQYPTAGYRHGLAPGILLPLLRVILPRARILVTIHEYVHTALLHRLYIAATAPWARAVITPDASQLRGFRLPGGVIVTEIPIASNIEPAGGPRRRNPDVLTVGTWGFLHPDKGIDRLIDAFADVVAVSPARLVIAGDPGPDSGYANEIRARATASPVGSRITFTGRLPGMQLSEALANFDVCVLPYAGGLEMNRGTYATARALGLPIVTTTTGEPRFDAESGTAFVRPGDRPALVQAILEASGRPRSLQTDPTAAWRSIALCHVDVYRSLVGGSAPAPG